VSPRRRGLIGGPFAAILAGMAIGRSLRTGVGYWLGALPSAGVVLSAVLAGCSYLLPIEEFIDSPQVAPDASLLDAPDDDVVGVGDDAGGEAAADAGPGSCPPSAFCVDFETRGLEAFLEQANENGALTIDSTASRSPPNSLLTTSIGSGIGDSRVFARTTFSGRPQVASLTADIRVDQPAANGTAGVLRLAFANGGYIELTVGNDGALDLFESSSQTSRSTGERLPLDTWGHFTLRADFAAAPARASVWLDGFQIGATTIGFPTDAPQITVGLSYTDERGWIVRYDNVVFEAQ
jgi:hypothetical protein